MRGVLSLLVILFPAIGLCATEPAHIDSYLLSSLIHGLSFITTLFTRVLFFKVWGFPLLIIWLAAAGIFFTFKLRFVNIRFFWHAIEVVRGKYDQPGAKGEVSHFQALTAAVSSTVGLGNIAGVAIAISMGGPGAVLWMMVVGFFAMSLKFTEVFLGQYFRRIDDKGLVHGGPQFYLKEGLKKIGFPKFGQGLAYVYVVLGIVGCIGAGNIFQINQAVAILSQQSMVFEKFDWAISAAVAISIAIILVGGIKRITKVTSKLVPFMAIFYVLSCLIIIGVNYNAIPGAINHIVQEAFTFQALGGGALGAVIAGVRRGTFSNEAGLGTASIAHAAARTDEPFSEASVSLLEPFIDTIVICSLSGLVIVVTGVYTQGGGIEGITLMSKAFATVSPWFTILLTVAACLFALSTLLTYSYYVEQLWLGVFSVRYILVYYLIFSFAIFVGGIIDDLKLIIDLADVFYLSLAIPNVIGLYMLTGFVKSKLREYEAKLK